MTDEDFHVEIDRLRGLILDSLAGGFVQGCLVYAFLEILRDMDDDPEWVDFIHEVMQSVHREGEEGRVVH